MADMPLQPDSDNEIRRRGAVAVVLREKRFLVIRRSAQVVAPGAFCFPGGGIEADESEAQALVREFREELGAAIAPLRRVWQSTTLWQVELAWWLGQIEPDGPLLPNPAEVASIHWLTSQEMLAHEHLLESNRSFLQALAAGQIALD
jgi:8-oxo-dGTP diphosphatase